MRYKSRYCIFLLLCVAIIATAVNAHTKMYVEIPSAPMRTLSYEQSETKQIKDFINYLSICSNKTVVEVEKSYKLKHYFMLLRLIATATSLTEAEKSIKNQLPHFQANNPISYYIYSLHKIII